MRLYTVIPKDIFSEAIKHKDDPFATIDSYDLAGTYNDSLLFYMNPILYYHNLDALENDAVYAFTAPSYARKLLNKTNVMVAFEAPDDSPIFSTTKFKQYAKTIQVYEKMENDRDFSKKDLMENALSDYLDNAPKYIAEINDYYDAFAPIESIPVSKIKYAVTQETLKAKKIKETPENSIISTSRGL